jgi:hypothetical protein
VADASGYAKGGFVGKVSSDHAPIYLSPGYVISKNVAQKFAKEALEQMNLMTSLALHVPITTGDVLDPMNFPPGKMTITMAKKLNIYAASTKLQVGTKIAVEDMAGNHIGSAHVSGSGEIQFDTDYTFSVTGPVTLVGFDFIWKDSQQSTLILVPKPAKAAPQAGKITQDSLAKIIADKAEEIGPVFKTEVAGDWNANDTMTMDKLNDEIAKVKSVHEAAKKSGAVTLMEELSKFNLTSGQVADLMYEVEAYSFYHSQPIMAVFDHLFMGTVTNPFKDPTYVPSKAPKKDHWSNLSVVAQKIAGWDGHCMGVTEEDCIVCSQPSKQSVDDSWVENWTPGSVKSSGSHWSIVTSTPGAGKTKFFTSGFVPDGKVMFLDTEKNGAASTTTTLTAGNFVIDANGIKITKLDEHGNPLGETIELGVAGQGKVTNKVKEFLDFVSNHPKKSNWNPTAQVAAKQMVEAMDDVEVSECIAGIEPLFKLKLFTKGVKEKATALLTEQMTYLKHNPPKKSPLTVPLFKAMKNLPTGPWSNEDFATAKAAAQETLAGTADEQWFDQVNKWLDMGNDSGEWTGAQYLNAKDSLKNAFYENKAKADGNPFPAMSTPGGQSLATALKVWQDYVLKIDEHGWSPMVKTAAALHAGQVFELCDDKMSVDSIAHAMTDWINKQNPKFPKPTFWSNNAKMSVAKAKSNWKSPSGKQESLTVPGVEADEALVALKEKLTGNVINMSPEKTAQAKAFGFLKWLKTLKDDGAMQSDDLFEAGSEVAVYWDHLTNTQGETAAKKSFVLWMNYLNTAGKSVWSKWVVANAMQALLYHSGAPALWSTELSWDIPDKSVNPKKKKKIAVKKKPMFTNDTLAPINPPSSIAKLGPLTKASVELSFTDAQMTHDASHIGIEHKQSLYDAPEVVAQISFPFSISQLMQGGEFTIQSGAQIAAPAPEPTPEPVVEEKSKPVKPKATKTTEVIHIKKGEQVIFLAEDEQYVTVPKGTKYTHIKR